MRTAIAAFSTLAILLMLIAVLGGEKSAFNGFFLFGGISVTLLLIEAKRERNNKRKEEAFNKHFKHWNRNESK